MNYENEYSDNDVVTLLLCSNIGMQNQNIIPLTDTAYDALARSLFKEGKQPSDLFCMSSENIFSLIKDNFDLFKRLKISDIETKIPMLLKRHQQMFLELSSLEREGIKILTRANRKDYPSVLISKFRKARIVLPSLIFYAGDLKLIGKNKTLAVVGSRDISADPSAEEFTKEIVAKAIASGYSISSGGARGIDITAEQAIIENSGNAIISVADTLNQRIKKPEIRHLLMDGKGVFLSLCHPNSRFKTFNAMNRNKIIYAVSNYAIVVSCDYQTKNVKGREIIDNNKGGTWVGCHECINKSLSTILCRSNGKLTPRGNLELLKTVPCIEVKEEDVFSPISFTNLIIKSRKNTISNEPIQTELF